MRVWAVFGPTGVGKTDIALALADRLRDRGERPVAVSADALQVYAGLEILTGAPSASQRERLEHRLVGVVPLTRTFSVGEYMSLAHATIDDLLASGETPIVVGGTGLYLRAAVASLDLRPPAPPDVRRRQEARVAALGPAGAHRELERCAPRVAAAIDPADRSRIVRALELLEVEGLPEEEAGESQLWAATTRHPTELVGLVMERTALYERIDARVDGMVAAGVRDEVARAQAGGVSPTARKALGFEELLRGDVAAMKRRTRNYAKRQLTWMRKLAGVRILDVTGLSADDAAARLLDGQDASRLPPPAPGGRPPPAPTEPERRP